MVFKILSLNVRVWTRNLNPFKWEHFWLPRTVKTRELFKRESPDIICLQERLYPLGKVAFGLWDYEVFGSPECHIPIYVKKSFLKEFTNSHNVEMMGTKETNGHGVNILTLKNSEKEFHIQNCHYSWEFDKLKNEMSCSCFSDTIFCGDMNNPKNKIRLTYSQLELSTNPMIIYDKTPAVDTYVNFDDESVHADIDMFGYVGENVPDVDVRVLPDMVSDHRPLIANVKIL